MDFEWNRAKARANEEKHGVSFAEASEVFADDRSSTVPDPDHSSYEERFLIFGQTKGQRYLAVAFTDRGDRIRIISARPMTRSERTVYEH
jgi:uncharacterized DUF497 family protein